MVVDELTSSQGIAALAAGLVAVVALVVATVLAFRLRRMRAEQSAVLGGHERRDLVEHAERLEAAFVQLRDWVEDSLGRFDEQVAQQDARIEGCVAHRALIRYDAYGEMSGQQSSSLALLDRRRSGVVVSSIVHRDQARVYVKQVNDGVSALQLSPEEQEAIDVALASEPGGSPELEAPASDARQSA